MISKENNIYLSHCSSFFLKDFMEKKDVLEVRVSSSGGSKPKIKKKPLSVIILQSSLSLRTRVNTKNIRFANALWEKKACTFIHPWN